MYHYGKKIREEKVKCASKLTSHSVVLKLHVMVSVKCIAKLAPSLKEDGAAHRPRLERSKDEDVFVARCVVQARIGDGVTVKLDEAIGVCTVDVDGVLVLGQNEPLTTHTIALQQRNGCL